MTTFTGDSNHDTDVPVLIVGGGPAGLVAAAELGHRGIRCLVVEPRTQVSHARPRAKTTSIRTMEHLRRLGVAEELRAAAPLSVDWSQRVTFCDTLTGSAVVDFDGAFGLGASSLELAAERGQQVGQPVLEDVLRGHLVGLDTVDLWWGARVADLDIGPDQARAVVVTADGRRRTVTARFVLGCDGPSSAVREAIGASYVGRSDATSNFNVLLRSADLDTALPPAVQYWVVGAPDSGVIGRLDHAGTWWAILPGVDAERGAAQLTDLLHGLVGRPFGFEVIATDSWTARMLIADSFGAGCAFLVGDSAHLNPPWGGHGYNTAIGDAVNIAWKIAAVLQGWAGPEILHSYEVERRPVVEQTVALAETNMAKLPGRLDADAEQIIAAKSAEFFSLGLVLGYSYAGSPIVQSVPGGATTGGDPDSAEYRPSTTPGARLPHHWLADGSSLYDHLGPGLTLLVPDDRSSVDEFRSRCRDRGAPLRVTRLPADYPWAGEFLLVRPDQHIAWRTDDPASIDLDHLLGISPSIPLVTRSQPCASPTSQTVLSSSRPTIAR
ncbi:FAD-binding protein [Nocardioides albidus]|uniref:FAD-binding protein n=1 Tax=Nocardioides albidus TaxID=1517589 RepID=A0A5C4VRL2_9ACTN|nr:FAD-dependent monooxygenase [Nocardioides albidus]TNM38522.1 FAD-binding protein [Nocardioides albidus]